MAKYTLTIQSDDASDILNALTVEAVPATVGETAVVKRGRKTKAEQARTSCVMTGS